MTFADVLEEFNRQQSVEIPFGPDDPWLGEKGSPVRLVLFSDFQCPVCQRFTADLMHIREHHPKLTVVFKHYPLSNQCSDDMSVDMHPLSCAAAYASEAARHQGKFWEYHDAMFASTQELEPDTLLDLARSIGFDMARFEADLTDPATSGKVKADVSLGNTLQIDGTPTAFLNGKKLTGNPMSMLEKLIEYHVKL